MTDVPLLEHFQTNREAGQEPQQLPPNLALLARPSPLVMPTKSLPRAAAVAKPRHDSLEHVL